LVVIFICGFAGGAAIPLSGEKKLNNLVSELLTTAKLTVSDWQSEKETGVPFGQAIFALNEFIYVD